MSKSYTEELARYRQLRAVSRSLHHTLTSRLPKDAIEECGKLLGIYRNGTLFLDSEDETSVLMDYCIYDWRRDGRNVIERYIAETSIEPDSDERILLDAMLEARYSLFVVDEVVDGLGVQTYDLLRGDGGFVMDVGLSKTAVKGLVLAGRIITPGDCAFSMTTGAALPADPGILRRMGREIPQRFGKTTSDIADMSPEKAAELSAFVIRSFLEGDASSHIVYEDNVKQEATRTKRKVGRNDPCPCGSGKKYKRCCGKPGKVVSPPDRRLMERDLRAVQKLVEGQDFASVDELNAYLRQLTAEGDIPEWVPETPLERAQELVYQALEAEEKKERIRLAMEAVNTCQDCVDAYVLLAEEAAETPEQARNWYQRGVEAGERTLGAEVFSEEMGHFWGLVETRPYMRAREGLADCLFFLSERDAALEHYRDTLRLNPNDNQGIRYKLLGCLVESNDIDAADELLGQFEGDISAVWLFTRALVTFIQQGDSPEAKERLREAMKQNPHVVPYLLGKRRMPRTVPDYVGIGDKHEAVAYVAEFAAGWRDIPGAQEWMKTTTQGKR